MSISISEMVILLGLF